MFPLMAFCVRGNTFITSGIVKLKNVINQIPINVVICPRAGQAFTLCLQLQRVNRESRRCACSPKNYHSAALEAMNSVRK